MLFIRFVKQNPLRTGNNFTFLAQCSAFIPISIILYSAVYNKKLHIPECLSAEGVLPSPGGKVLSEAKRMRNGDILRTECRKD